MEAIHNVDEFDEFEGVNRYPPNYNRQPKPTINNQPKSINQNSQMGAAKMPASSYLGQQHNPVSGSRDGASRSNQNKPINDNRNRIGSRGMPLNSNNLQQVNN